MADGIAAEAAKAVATAKGAAEADLDVAFLKLKGELQVKGMGVTRLSNAAVSVTVYGEDSFNELMQSFHDLWARYPAFSIAIDDSPIRKRIAEDVESAHGRIASLAQDVRKLFWNSAHSLELALEGAAVAFVSSGLASLVFIAFNKPPVVAALITAGAGAALGVGNFLAKAAKKAG